MRLMTTCRSARRSALARICALGATAFVVSGCVATKDVDEQTTGSISASSSAGYGAKERNCLERAMYFESNRSSEEGLVAVGTVVMNRVASEEYPDSICGVVGQKNQFAPGVLSRNLPREKVPEVVAAADRVLKGERHPDLKVAKFFHMAGLSFPYDNMHYKLVAGGNAFYEKR